MQIREIDESTDVGERKIVAEAERNQAFASRYSGGGTRRAGEAKRIEDGRRPPQINPRHADYDGDAGTYRYLLIRSVHCDTYGFIYISARINTYRNARFGMGVPLFGPLSVEKARGVPWTSRPCQEEHRSSRVTWTDCVPRPDLREHALSEIHALVEFGELLPHRADFVMQLLHRFGKAFAIAAWHFSHLHLVISPYLQRRDAEATEDGEYRDKDTYCSWVHTISIPFPVGSNNDDRDESQRPVTYRVDRGARTRKVAWIFSGPMEQSGADVSREVVDLCALHVQRYAWLAVLLRKESPAAHRQSVMRTEG